MFSSNRSLLSAGVEVLPSAQEHFVAEYLLLGCSAAPAFTRLRLPMLLRRRPAQSPVAHQKLSWCKTQRRASPALS